MSTDRRSPRRCLLLTLVVAALPSCATAQEAIGVGALIRPLRTDDTAWRSQLEAIPQEKKDRVHFFLINGLDPLYFGNLNGVAAHFRALGFRNTSCYQFPMAPKVRKQIETIRRSDPDAQIVLLGYSVGANVARSMANTLEKDGIRVACLVYLGGDTVFNSPSSRPSNVGKIVNINAHGAIIVGRNLYFKGEEIDGAVNQRINVRHITLPVQQEAVDLMTKELIALANGPTAAPPVAVAPTPTPVPAIVVGTRREP